MALEASRRWPLVVVSTSIALAATAAEGPMRLAFGTVGAAPAAPWRVSGLPNQSKPFTTFSVVDLDGRRAVRIEADRSYGNLVHPVAPDGSMRHLAWQWRLEEPLKDSDLRTKSGEDIALKVCVFFDMPIERVPFVERQILRVVRSRSSEPVPAATVCYVWDTQIAIGSAVESPFTRRIRYRVLESGSAKLRRWTAERRDLAADFRELFGSESQDVPPIVGIAVGADADNTQAHSVGFVADVVLEP